MSVCMLLVLLLQAGDCVAVCRVIESDKGLQTGYLAQEANQDDDS